MQNMIRSIFLALPLLIFSALATQAQPSGTITLYEGSSCSQDVIGTFNAVDGVYRRGDLGANDEARSMALTNINVDLKITIYDHPDGHTSDDWSIIQVDSVVDYVCIESFESSIGQQMGDSAGWDISYHKNNGLDGKVSRMKVEVYVQWLGTQLVSIDSSEPAAYAAVWRPSTDTEIQLYDALYTDYRAYYDKLWNEGWRLHILFTH